MYAIIRDRNQQTKVQQGDVILCDFKSGSKAGDKVVFEEVLLVGNEGKVTIGKPTVAGAKVTGAIVEHGRGDKLVVFKFRRRKNYVRRNGHRQNYTAVKIADIQA